MKITGRYRRTDKLIYRQGGIGICTNYTYIQIETEIREKAKEETAVPACERACVSVCLCPCLSSPVDFLEGLVCIFGGSPSSPSLCSSRPAVLFVVSGCDGCLLVILHCRDSLCFSPRRPGPSVFFLSFFPFSLSLVFFSGGDLDLRLYRVLFLFLFYSLGVGGIRCCFALIGCIFRYVRVNVYLIIFVWIVFPLLYSRKHTHKASKEPRNHRNKLKETNENKQGEQIHKKSISPSGT